jgi:hypothetical protein
LQNRRLPIAADISAPRRHADIEFSQEILLSRSSAQISHSKRNTYRRLINLVRRLLTLNLVTERKETKMKSKRLFLAAVLFTSLTGGALSNAIAQDGVISKDELATGSYCHEKFPPMTTQTLDSNDPTLNNSGTIIDFYGPCDENPVGKDQIQEQKLEEQHRFANGYED